MRTTRAFGIAASLAGATAALAACSPSAADEAGPTTLTVWDGLPYEPFHSTALGQLEACAADLGATIEQETIAADQLTSQVLNAASAGSLPDVLYIDGAYIPELAGAGVLEDLSALGLSTDGLTESVASMGVADGTLYGIAPSVNTAVLFYSTAMFEEAGLEPPTTFDELVDVASALAHDDVTGLAISADATGAGAYMFLPFLLNAGGDPADLGGPGTAEALQLYADLVATGGVSPNIVNLGWDAPALFPEGRAAMMLSQDFSVPQLDDAGVEFGMVALPTLEAGATPRSVLGGELWTVPAGDHTDIASQVVACMTSDENQVAMADASYRTPASDAAQAEYTAERPEVAVFADLVPTSYNRTAELGAGWPEIELQLGEMIQLVVTGEATPEEAIAEVVG